jgi:hypothetical protein
MSSREGCDDEEAVRPKIGSFKEKSLQKLLLGGLPKTASRAMLRWPKKKRGDECRICLAPVLPPEGLGRGSVRAGVN